MKAAREDNLARLDCLFEGPLDCRFGALDCRFGALDCHFGALVRLSFWAVRLSPNPVLQYGFLAFLGPTTPQIAYCHASTMCGSMGFQAI